MTRMLAVGLVVLGGCARSLDDLMPFPCPDSGLCQEHAVCSRSWQCERVEEDKTCAKETRAYSTSSQSDAKSFVCVGGTLAQGCPCPKGRSCRDFGTGQKACLLDCDDGGCAAAGLSCQLWSGQASCVAVDLTPPGSGTGLLGNVYLGTDLRSPASAVVDGPIDFHNRAWPVVGTTNVSVRYTGFIEARATGSHVFWVASDDGVRLTLDGSRVVDDWNEHGITYWNAPPLELVAGQRVSVVLEHFNKGGPSDLKLGWDTPLGNGVISRSQLYQP